MPKEFDRSMKMFKVMDRMRKAWIEITPKPEVSKSQFGTLLALRHGSMDHSHSVDRDPFEPMTLSMLSLIMGQSMPAVSQRISKLEAAGYVQRIPDEKDKRTIWIQLTPSGVELLESSYQNMVSKLDFIMEQLGEEDTETMLRVLDKLAGIIESSVSHEQKQQRPD